MGDVVTVQEVSKNYRLGKLNVTALAGVSMQVAAVRCFAQDAMDRIETSARRLLAAVDEGDTLRTYLAALKRFTKRETLNTVALRRQVAEAIVEADGYPLS